MPKRRIAVPLSYLKSFQEMKAMLTARHLSPQIQTRHAGLMQDEFLKGYESSW